MTANSLVTTAERDVLGRVTEVELPDGTQQKTVYDACSSCSSVQGATPAHKIVQTTENLNTSTQGAPDRNTYLDVLGRVIRDESEGFDGSLVKTDFEYGSHGQLAKRYLPATGTPSKSIAYTYDDLNRVTNVDNPGTNGGSSAIAFAPGSGSYVLQVANTETVEGGSGTDTLIKVSRFNAAGQLIEVLENCSSTTCTNGDAVKTEYDYDAAGNLDWTRVDGNAATITTMVCDNAGNKTSIVEPNSGTTSFDYDALGLLQTQTDARSQVTTFEYDLLGRMTQRVDGSVTNDWTYDTAYDGTLEKVVQTVSSVEQFREAYTYDTLVRPKKTTTTIDEHSGSFVHEVLSYDDYSRPTKIEYPSTLEVTLDYNSYGYFEEYKDGSNSLSKITSADGFGNVTGLSLGNGLSTTRGYDADSGRLESITTGSIQDNEYVWRSNGSLHSREQGSTVETFTYDDLNRMTDAVITGERTLAYQYNDLGNITSKTDTDGDNLTSWSYTTGGPHTVNSVSIGGTTATYVYDASGNATTARGRTITYNSFNKPTHIDYPAGDAETTFEYAPDRARFRQFAEYTEGADDYEVETFYLAGGLYEKTITTKNSTVESTIERCYVGDSYLEVNCGDTSPTQYYLLRDHLGSIDSITNSSGTEVDDMAFDPYGARREPDWSEVLPLADGTAIADAKTTRGFTHHEHLDRTGFVHMNGRLYDPVIGRFLSADPIVQAPTSSQNYNRYSYVFNNPMSFTNPSGYFTCSVNWWPPSFKCVGDDNEESDDGTVDRCEANSVNYSCSNFDSFSEHEERTRGTGGQWTQRDRSPHSWLSRFKGGGEALANDLLDNRERVGHFLEAEGVNVFLNFGQVFGGAGQLMLGGGICYGSGGLACVGGILIGAKGADNIQAGLRGTDSVAQQLLVDVTGSETAGSLINAGLDIGTSVYGLTRGVPRLATGWQDGTRVHTGFMVRDPAFIESSFQQTTRGLIMIEGATATTTVVDTIR